MFGLDYYFGRAVAVLSVVRVEVSAFVPVTKSGCGSLRLVVDPSGKRRLSRR